MGFFDQIDSDVNAELAAQHDSINEQADALKRERAVSTLAELRTTADEAKSAADAAQAEFDERFPAPTPEPVVEAPVEEVPAEEPTGEEVTEPQG